jgi:hypothetical protein
MMMNGTKETFQEAMEVDDWLGRGWKPSGIKRLSARWTEEETKRLL